MAKDIHTNSSLSVHSDWSGVSREPFQMYMSWRLREEFECCFYNRECFLFGVDNKQYEVYNPGRK